MIYRRFFAITLVIVLTFLFLPVPNALAANDDFEVEYEFFPEPVPYKGGDIQLILDIENVGATNITWIDVVINTATTYSERWTGTIAPGATRTISFYVPFEEADLNVQKILQVSMNNNMTTNPDGVKMFTFTLEGTRRIFERTAETDPERASYAQDELVEVIHYFRNNIATHAAINARTQLFIWVNGVAEYVSPIVTHGNIFPGAQVSHTTVLDLSGFSPGSLSITSNIKFTMMGKEYSMSMESVTFEIEAPEPDIGFITALYATPAEIEAGDTVEFQVSLQNTGGDPIDYFEIRNSEGGLLATTGSFAPGESDIISVGSVAIYETTDVSYVVIAYSGDYYDSAETNTVHITVTEPTATAAPTATPTQTPTPEPSTESTPEATPSGASLSESPSEAGAAGSPSDAADLSEAPEEGTGENAGLSFGIFVLIALAVLVIAALIIVTILLLSRRNGKKTKDSEFD